MNKLPTPLTLDQAIFYKEKFKNLDICFLKNNFVFEKAQNKDCNNYYLIELNGRKKISIIQQFRFFYNGNIELNQKSSFSVDKISKLYKKRQIYIDEKTKRCYCINKIGNKIIQDDFI